jgi:hypothetical protein
MGVIAKAVATPTVLSERHLQKVLLAVLFAGPLTHAFGL